MWAENATFWPMPMLNLGRIIPPYQECDLHNPVGEAAKNAEVISYSHLVLLPVQHQNDDSL